ncbi:MAG: T9SS type A sorting domain-containing protein [Bacteroidetes bacterium]|nr:T9SS type A sorting domain-containing protein [Bacteroidota bacterium]
MDFVLEGCVSISDTSGNLLFYSDGWKVWNKNHQVMPNGMSLIIYGAPTTSQILSVPKPENENIHYIFSLGYDSTGFDGEWRYAIVDMSLQSGLGDVLTKRNFLCNNATETMTAVRHANNNDIWIITMQRNTNSFYSYLLTSAGLNTTPVISNAGFSTDHMIFLKASPDGKKLAVAFLFNGPEILDFDKSTGMVSNPILFPPISGQSNSYGPEFSPDNKKLYFIYMLEITPAVTFTNPVYQIDLIGTPSQILNSKILLDSFIVNDSFATNFNDNFTSALQLGPDYKIYGAKYTRSKLAVINSPNTLGVGCNFIDSAVYLQGKICGFGLPNFMNDYFFDSALISVTEVSEVQEPIICYPNPFNYTANIIIPSSLNIMVIEMLDLLGRKIEIKKKITKENGKTVVTIERNNLPVGIYLLNIKTNNNIYSQKLVITN